MVKRINRKNHHSDEGGEMRDEPVPSAYQQLRDGNMNKIYMRRI